MLPCMNWQSAFWATSGGRSCWEPGIVWASPFPAGLIRWRCCGCCWSCGREFGIVVSVVHFNHTLRGAESLADHEFVAKLAREHGLEFYVESGDVAAYAARSMPASRQLHASCAMNFFGGCWGLVKKEKVPQGLKPGSVTSLMIAALKALRHPKAQV